MDMYKVNSLVKKILVEGKELIAIESSKQGEIKADFELDISDMERQYKDKEVLWDKLHEKFNSKFLDNKAKELTNKLDTMKIEAECGIHLTGLEKGKAVFTIFVNYKANELIQPMLNSFFNAF